MRLSHSLDVSESLSVTPGSVELYPPCEARAPELPIGVPRCSTIATGSERLMPKEDAVVHCLQREGRPLYLRGLGVGTDAREDS